MSTFYFLELVYVNLFGKGVFVDTQRSKLRILDYRGGLLNPMTGVLMRNRGG